MEVVDFHNELFWLLKSFHTKYFEDTLEKPSQNKHIIHT